jgi:hypothetical protein
MISAEIANYVSEIDPSKVMPLVFLVVLRGSKLAMQLDYHYSKS